jgi:hypothetical protein
MKKNFKLNPRILFLVDGLGALVTAFFLFVVLKIYEEYIGMPQVVLNYLSMIAVLLSFYSMSCFFLLKDQSQIFLRIIGVANLLYCCLTMGLLIYNYQVLTILGATYFLTEIIIICGLAFFELNTLAN